MLRRRQLHLAIAGALTLSLLTPVLSYAQAGTCSVAKLQLQFLTGNDDLRGGENNINAQVQFTDGSIQPFNNLNNGQNWSGHSFHTVYIQLKQAVPASQIKQITLVHLAQGGENVNQSNFNTALAAGGPPAAAASMLGGINTEDNWDMAQLKAVAEGTGVSAQIASAGPYKFTGSNPSLTVPVTAPPFCGTGGITQLRLTIDTGNDDLRGGNDNLNVIIHYADGSPDQFEANVNHSIGWPNNSRRDATVFLVRTSVIDSITLQTTFTGGSGGDNWNMDEVQVTGIGSGIHQNLATTGFHRFTGPPGNALTIPITGWPAPPAVSGGVSHCSPTDTSDYCRMARMGRSTVAPTSAVMLPDGSNPGLVGQTQTKGLLQPSNATGSALRNSQPQPMLAQSPQPGMTSAPKSPLLAQTPGHPTVLTNADVITMLRSRKPESEIISSINSTQHRFDFSTAGCRSLTEAQVSQNILKAMNNGGVMPCTAAPTPSTLKSGRRIP